MSTKPAHKRGAKPNHHRPSLASYATSPSPPSSEQAHFAAGNFQDLAQQHILNMQHHYGNAYVQRFLGRQDSRAAVRSNLIQRWDSPEHVALGDQASGGPSGYIVIDCLDRELPQRRDAVETWPRQWQTLYQSGDARQQRFLKEGLTYGEIVALSGDFYSDYDALNKASLREVYDLIPLIRSGATTGQLQSATGGRYLALAEANERHFSNVAAGKSNIETWRIMHREAIKIARSGNANQAWGLNAASDHFLTDAFSGGHIRTPRSQLLQQGAMGQFESKVLHDLDNEHGVEVTNQRGDTPWIAYGDDMLADPRNDRNRALSVEAVELSKKDIADALAQGQNYPEPDESTHFEAERLVPHAVNPNQDRWSGRTPSYTMTPDGMPIRQADDYTMTRDRVIASEGPGIVAGLFNDDNQIREWVSKQDLNGIGRQPASEKIRMINVLLNGWISDDDVAAIERICQSVTTGDEMAQIRSAIEPRLLEMTGLGQRMRVRIAIRRRP